MRFYLRLKPGGGLRQVDKRSITSAPCLYYYRRYPGRLTLMSIRRI